MTQAPSALTKRWTPLREHAVQYALANTTARFITNPAGRRSGKTEILKRRVVQAAMLGTSFDNPRFFVGAPTYAQAKRIFWEDLKALTPKWMLAGRPSESELVIRLINGAETYVVGLDKPERVEGTPWDGCGIDEFGNTKPQTWEANIRPALSDRGGWAVLCGVPEGRNHYYTRDLAAQADKTGEWASFTWKSADILPAAEIEAARRDLDPLTFEQEYEASFINFTGRAYYAFDARVHAPAKCPVYNPKQPLIFTFDFNVAPGTAAIIQELPLPGQYKRDKLGLVMLDKPITGTAIIGEVYIPRNSNTERVCAKLIADWGQHQGRVVCYGDATGGAEGSAKVRGSDWDLIKRDLTKHFGDRISYVIDAANPRERVRVNAMNTRLLNGAGEIHMMVDPERASKMVRDLDGVSLLVGGSGEIDKKKNPELTHLTDGVGYYVAKQFPIAGQSMQTVRITGA